EDDRPPVSSALGWRPIPPPKLPRETDLARARVAVNNLFRAIERGLGIDVARQLFNEIATPSTRPEQEEISRCILLSVYTHLRQLKGWSHIEVVRHLARMNEEHKKDGLIVGVRKYTEGAIYEELRHLLERPPKKQSPILRDLIEQANELPKT